MLEKEGALFSAPSFFMQPLHSSSSVFRILLRLRAEGQVTIFRIHRPGDNVFSQQPLAEIDIPAT